MAFERIQNITPGFIITLRQVIYKAEQFQSRQDG
jgi:hypothetical protein